MLIKYWPVYGATGLLYTGDIAPNIYFAKYPDLEGWDFENDQWGEPLHLYVQAMTKVGNHWEFDWTGGDAEDLIVSQANITGIPDIGTMTLFFQNSAEEEPDSNLLVIEQIAHYLHAEALGTFDPDGTGGNIFIETMPDTPDEAIGLYSTGGLAPDIATSVARPGAQIIVRGSRDPRLAAAKALAIQGALHGMHSTEFVSDETRIMLCAARQSEPIALGPDENGRHEYSINLLLITGGD